MRLCIKNVSHAWFVKFDDENFAGYSFAPAGAFPDCLLLAMLLGAVLEAGVSGRTTLWRAEYGVSAPRRACSFWQWSAGAAVPGITLPCDCDVYLGTMEELEGMRMG